MLTEPHQLDHHDKPAFAALLAAASQSPDLRVNVGKKEVSVAGAILIWGATTPEGRSLVTSEKGFAAILTLSEIVRDLQAWRSEPFRNLLALHRTWSNELYDGLLGITGADA